MAKKKDMSIVDKAEKPKVYIDTIVFNDNTELKLNSNSIIVFTGANNSGKSQVLKDIEMCANKSGDYEMKIVKGCNFIFQGSILEEEFLRDNFIINQEGLYQMIEFEDSFKKNQLINYWNDSSMFWCIYRLFVRRISTIDRITASKAFSRIEYNHNSILKLYKNERKAQLVSDYFKKAFDCDLVINRNDLTSIPLHIGKAPNKKQFTIDRQEDYYNLIDKLPLLDAQGDGMRSFATLLLNAFTSNYSITLIDEPEAFLHPPQARILGKMISQINGDNRQIIISTHSEDFLLGLIDSGNVNISVIRINRDNKINHMSVLENDKLQKLWGNPILRYSNALSGVFHKLVVVCESDYDCLFYQAIIDAIYEKKNEISPDILFTHCGGKGRIKDIVSALKAVDVPVVAISDFDVINSSQIFKSMIESFGIDWDILLSNDMKTIYDSMNSKNSNGYDAWCQIKKIGKSGFTGKEPLAYERVEAICKTNGLFIVPVGEMECFDKTINKEKKDWVYSVLEKYDLSNEPKLEEARKFVMEIVEFGMRGIKRRR